MNDVEQEGNSASRKFDDVASLFGSIVPAPGSPLRPLRPFRPLPVGLPDPSAKAIVPPPPSVPKPLPEADIPGDPAPAAAQGNIGDLKGEHTDDLPGEHTGEHRGDPIPLRPAEPSSAPIPLRAIEPKVPQIIVEEHPVRSAAPKPPARPRPTEIPWPDAFEPRPNYRKAEPRNWSWLLLIPAGIVVAGALTLIDTRALRVWVDANLLHRTPIAALDSPLLPAPFRTGASGQAADATAAPEAPNPYPAIPTSPLPVPEGTVASPAPVDPAQAGAPAPLHVVIQYRRNIPGSDGEARRLAALLQNTGGSVETRPNATTDKTPTITYYNAGDKEVASAIAIILANEAANWTVRLGTTKNPPGSVDVSLP